LLLALAVPGTALPNGGPSHWVEARMEGAVLPGDGGRLDAVRLVRDEDVECTSEVLTISLRAGKADVQVEYVLVNHGAAKHLEYAFPFAIAEQEVVRDAKRRKYVLGKPGAYSLKVNGEAVAAVQRPGLEVDPDIPVPTIDDNRDIGDVGEWTAPEDGHGQLADGRIQLENRYRYTYYVSPLDLPAGESVRLTVTYASPYLVYTKRNEETGQAESPPAFTYLLSTGDRWRGGKIGKLTVRVRAAKDGLPFYVIDGLPFARKGDVATYEAQDVVPTADMNLVIRRSDFARFELAPIPGVPQEVLQGNKAKAWVSPPVGGDPVVTLVLTPTQVPEFRAEAPRKRFRLDLAARPGTAQPARVLVVLKLPDGRRDAFQATFGEAGAADLAAGGGYRAIYFDAPAVPNSVEVTFLEVRPGSKGDRALQLTGIVLEQDVTNYTAWVPLPR
jgi:hypothetical protein